MAQMSAANDPRFYFIGAKHFKSIGEERVGFSEFKHVNVIVGKNNSGKSTLLDVLERFVDSKKRQVTPLRNDSKLELIVGVSLTKDIVVEGCKYSQDRFTFAGKLASDSEGELTCLLKGVDVWWDLNSSTRIEFEDKSFASGDASRQEAIVWARSAVTPFLPIPLVGYSFHRINADRDVVPEKVAPDKNQSVGGNGVGVTRAIAEICTSMKRDLVEVELLKHLNMVFNPECKFERIIVVQDEDQIWELVFEEPLKGRIRLSQMGSGVKTVLLVLMYLIVLPKQKKDADVSKMIFGFEELENNLHPSIQRRLFMFLRDFAVDNDTMIFLTTHSSIVVDMFSSDENAQLIHVTHDGKVSSAKQVNCWKDGCDVIDDLGIRASDLLQSNGIVWVEGPSDRIYFNQWIELWTEGELTEHVHYQCVPFGGSSNAHYRLDDPDEGEELIAALRLNRNAILLIDRDSREDGDLKLHTQRMVDEIEGIAGFGWVTQGKEVENYIPKDALAKFVPDLPMPDQTEDVVAAIQTQSGKTSISKSDIANRIKGHLTRDMLEKHLDMKEKLDEVVKRIKEWNQLALEKDADE